MRFAVSHLRAFYDVPLKWGLCVPSGCSTEDIRQAIKYSKFLFFMFVYHRRLELINC